MAKKKTAKKKAAKKIKPEVIEYDISNPPKGHINMMEHEVDRGYIVFNAVKPLFSIDCESFFVSGINNNQMIEEFMACNQTVSDDITDTMVDDLTMPNRPGSECEKFVNTVAEFFRLRGLRICGNPWASVNRPREQTEWHTHRRQGGLSNQGHNHHLAFIYYLNVPRKSGDLVFGFDEQRTETPITPRESELILFDARLQHRVRKNRSKEIRLSVSGNLVWDEEDLFINDCSPNTEPDDDCDDCGLTVET